MYLLLSVAALLAGPYVYALGQTRRQARYFCDGFVFITIAGIVCVHIIPSALTLGGALALVFLLAGLCFPVLLERVFHRAMHRAHGVVLLLAALGLAVHAVLDGIALVPVQVATQEGLVGAFWSNQLALSVILHRVPVGMAIWWSLKPEFGQRAAVATFALIIGFTTIAYVFAGPMLALAETRSLAYFQSFVAGSLVHVVAFGISHAHDARVEPGGSVDAWGYRLGILLGMFLVFTLPLLHG